MEGKNNFYKIFFDENDVQFVENKFLWAKFEQQLFRGKAYEICNSMTSFTAHDKKTSFMTGILER